MFRPHGVPLGAELANEGRGLEDRVHPQRFAGYQLPHALDDRRIRLPPGEQEFAHVQGVCAGTLFAEGDELVFRSEVHEGVPLLSKWRAGSKGTFRDGEMARGSPVYKEGTLAMSKCAVRIC